MTPEPGLQELVEFDRLRRFGNRGKPTARIAVIAAILAHMQACRVAEVLIERAGDPQRFEQDLLVLLRDLLVERALIDALCKEFGYVAVIIGRDMAVALRLAVEGFCRVQIGVVVDLDEGLELDAETLAVVEHRVVMIGDAPGDWIEIEPLVEPDFLREATHFGVGLAAAQRPAAAAGLLAIFQHLHLVAGPAKLHRRDHARQARPEDQHGRALRIAVQPDRLAIGRLLRKT